MVDLPNLTPEDLNKVPQSNKDTATEVIAYTDLAPYFFKRNLIYKAGDVFVVDNDLGLSVSAIARTAADGHIPEDIKYQGMAVTTGSPTAPSLTVSIAAGSIQKGAKTIISSPSTGSPSGITPNAGGISWISCTAANTFWGNHDRAFDAGDPAAPIIAGVQGVIGGNGAGAGFTSIHYLGASIAGYPLYSLNMCFRALGYKSTGLGIGLDATHGFLQIGSGTVNSWYKDDIRIPQRSKSSFYYAHSNTILNSPVLVVTTNDLKRKDVDGTLTPTVSGEMPFHFVYLDPDTSNIYIVIGSEEGALKNLSSHVPGAYLIDAIDAHSKTTIPDFLRENGVLLGALGFFSNLANTDVYQLHNFLPGSGNAIHPGVPSPQDYPYGGTLKSKNNIFQIMFDYDSYLINEATLLKKDYLFVYDSKFPLGIGTSKYQTDSLSLVTLLGMGGHLQPVDTGYPFDYSTYGLSWYDRGTYQDVNEKGLYYGSYIVHTATASYPEYVQIAEIRGTTEVQYVPSGSNFIPSFCNTIPVTKQVANNTYTTHMGYPKIPGLNGGAISDNGTFAYDSALRAKRATHGSADSVIALERLGPPIIYPDQQLQALMKYMTTEVVDFIYQLIPLIGTSLVAQFKEKYEMVKKAGLLGSGRIPFAIVGYCINNNSANSKTEYSIIGVRGITVNSTKTTIVIDPAYPIAIQPADVVGLPTGDLTPLQAVIVFLQIRYNYLQHLFGGFDSFQITEIPIS